jgi:hypothetical protein
LLLLLLLGRVRAVGGGWPFGLLLRVAGVPSSGQRVSNKERIVLSRVML